MNATSFCELVQTATKHGWASGNLDLDLVRYGARELGYAPVPIRKGAGDVVELRPTTSEEAHERSLSATVGLGEQPMHTDGAHLPEPPDIVVLHAVVPNTIPTLLWSPLNKLTNPRHPLRPAPAHICGGMFLVGSGRERFLTGAYEDFRYRYDPGCMTPCDERARAAIEYFTSIKDEAHRYEWTQPNQVLVIDNRVTLHARTDASNDSDRVLSRVAYRMKAAT